MNGRTVANVNFSRSSIVTNFIAISRSARGSAFVSTSRDFHGAGGSTFSFFSFRLIHMCSARGARVRRFERRCTRCHARSRSRLMRDFPDRSRLDHWLLDIRISMPSWNLFAIRSRWIVREIFSSVSSSGFKTPESPRFLDDQRRKPLDIFVKAKFIPTPLALRDRQLKNRMPKMQHEVDYTGHIAILLREFAILLWCWSHLFIISLLLEITLCLLTHCASAIRDRWTQSVMNVA